MTKEKLALNVASYHVIAADMVRVVCHNYDKMTMAQIAEMLTTVRNDLHTLQRSIMVLKNLPSEIQTVPQDNQKS